MDKDSGTEYLPVLEEMTFDDAKAYCDARGATIMTIGAEDEQTKLKSLMEHLKNDYGGPEGPVFMGGCQALVNIFQITLC